MLAVWRCLAASRKPSSESPTPPVSVLKPVCGREAELLTHLATFCRLDYPDYELIFCCENSEDPAVEAVRELAERFPERDIRLVTGGGRAGFNPKVRNLLAGYAAARNPVLLISDSNVSVPSGYLREAVSHLADPGVGLVSHLIRGTGGRSLGAHLENGYLNSFVLGSICLLDRMLGFQLVVGKSMLFRRADVEAVGGLAAVKDHLAEDYLLGRLLVRAGKRVVVSGCWIDTGAGARPVRSFLARHARWNRMRFAIAGPGYLLEPLGNPVLLALLLAAQVALEAAGVVGWSPESVGRPAGEALAVAAAGVAAKLGLDVALNRLLAHPLARPALLLGPLRDLMSFGLWLSAFWSSTVEWRGSRYRIGRETRLLPVMEPRLGEELGEGLPAPVGADV